jgi:hypothetical protein
MTSTKMLSGYWAYTQVTAQDAVRLGLCVADGRAAGPGTPWILSEMRQVRGGITPTESGGRWGIVDGLPDELAQETSIKNGWTMIYADGNWHLNCLAINPDWILAVLTRYPGSLGKAYGANVCKQVTQQLLVNADS